MASSTSSIVLAPERSIMADVPLRSVILMLPGVKPVPPFMLSRLMPVSTLLPNRKVSVPLPIAAVLDS